MPNRWIRESARTSKNLNEVSDFAERLFWRLITTADDYGRFLACGSIVKSACFPLMDSIRLEKIEKALSELVDKRLIRLYSVGDRRYGLFLKWVEHQGAPRSKHSKYPDPLDSPIESQNLQTSVNICTQMFTSASRNEHACAHSDSETDSKTSPNSLVLNPNLNPDPDPERNPEKKENPETNQGETADHAVHSPDGTLRVSHSVPPQDGLWGLLHDAAEAYLGDMMSPIKYHTECGALFQRLEAGIMEAVCQRFGLTQPMPVSVARADHEQLQEEQHWLREPLTGNSWRRVVTMPPLQAELEFLNRYRELTE